VCGAIHATKWSEKRKSQWIKDKGQAISLHSRVQRNTNAGKILEGKVDQSEARRYYPEDPAAGFVLLCSAFSRSDLRI
jgi:hypothetical protein